jgi:serine/threonine-protein kinase
MAGAWIILSSWLITRLRARNLIGEALGQYTLVQKLGEGGMGEVFLARHAHLRRPAAVKLLRRDRLSLGFLEQFEREAQAASRLRHPNTVEIYDFGRTEEGVPYLAMEFVNGLDLGQCIRRDGAMKPARAVHIARQICSALEEAHEQGVIHRDLKPANVMVCDIAGRRDFVKLLDFGLATGPGDETSPLMRSGTPFYTAPERLLGNAPTDHRCDFYSLGVLLYFLLCGETPAPPDADWIEWTLTGEPMPLSGRVQVPPGLESLILDCMSRDPAARPGSARELLDRLDRVEAVATSAV